MSHDIRADDLVLFATNTGSLYPQHCWYARRGFDDQVWRQHVFAVVFPIYCHEFGQCVLRPSVLLEVATTLRVYYQEHVKEVGDS